MIPRVLLITLLTACAASTPKPLSPPPVAPAQTTKPDDCKSTSVVQHPEFSSDTLTLDLRLRAPRPGMVIPPFKFEVRTRDVLPKPVSMELTIYGPEGRKHIQEFQYENQHEQCDPHCLPSGPVNNCRPRRCWMERYRPRAQSISPDIYRGSPTGRWTFVLKRSDTGDRVSVSARLLGGAVAGGKAATRLDQQCSSAP